MIHEVTKATIQRSSFIKIEREVVLLIKIDLEYFIPIHYAVGGFSKNRYCDGSAINSWLIGSGAGLCLIR